MPFSRNNCQCVQKERKGLIFRPFRVKEIFYSTSGVTLMFHGSKMIYIIFQAVENMGPDKLALCGSNQ